MFVYSHCSEKLKLIILDVSQDVWSQPKDVLILNLVLKQLRNAFVTNVVRICNSLLQVCFPKITINSCLRRDTLITLNLKNNLTYQCMYKSLCLYYCLVFVYTSY